MDVDFLDIQTIGKNRILLKARMRIPHLQYLKIKSVFELTYHILVQQDNRLKLYLIKSDMDALKNHASKENKIIDPKTTERIRAFYRSKFGRELVYDGRA